MQGSEACQKPTADIGGCLADHCNTAFLALTEQAKPNVIYTVVENAFSGTANPDAEVELTQAWADSADKEKLGGMSAVCFLFAR